jgi:hypothetical protein
MQTSGVFDRRLVSRAWPRGRACEGQMAIALVLILALIILSVLAAAYAVTAGI